MWKLSSFLKFWFTGNDIGDKMSRDIGEGLKVNTKLIKFALSIRQKDEISNLVSVHFFSLRTELDLMEQRLYQKGSSKTVHSRKLIWIVKKLHNKGKSLLTQQIISSLEWSILEKHWRQIQRLQKLK